MYLPPPWLNDSFFAFQQTGMSLICRLCSSMASACRRPEPGCSSAPAPALPAALLPLQSFTAGTDFGDFVVWTKDDLPSYQLSCVVDDAGAVLAGCMCVPYLSGLMQGPGGWGLPQYHGTEDWCVGSTSDDFAQPIRIPSGYLMRHVSWHVAMLASTDQGSILRLQHLHVLEPVFSWP
jgi:hypothetical protein